MITPTMITDFSRSTRDLQVFWLFSMFVAGKNSDIASRNVNNVIRQMPGEVLPFDWFRVNDIESVLRQCKVGQYGRLTKAILGSLDLDLKVATLDQLLGVHGVGPKTARFFLLHTRKDCNCAVLDVHILRYLRNAGHPDAPKQTPANKIYLYWEKIFLDLCKVTYPNRSIAEVDLYLWTQLSGRS